MFLLKIMIWMINTYWFGVFDSYDSAQSGVENKLNRTPRKRFKIKSIIF